MKDLVGRRVITPEIVSIEQKEGTRFTRLHGQMRVASRGLGGDNHHPSRAHIAIFGIELCLLVGRELVGNRRHAVGQVKIKMAVSVIHAVGIGNRCVVIAISRGHEHSSEWLSGRVQLVGGQALSGGPKARTRAVGGRIIGARLSQGRRVVAEDPPVPGAVVSMGSKSDVDDAIEQ